MSTVNLRKGSKPKVIDSNPTNVNGWNPDSEGRFAVGVDGDNQMTYLCDGEPVPFEDGFGALTGRDSIPSKIKSSNASIPNWIWETIFGGKK